MKGEIIRIFKEEIGENKVFDDEDHRRSYSADESGI